MPIPKELVTGIILLGGRSTRMGRDKATVMIDDRPLWQIATETLTPHVQRILFVGSDRSFRPPAPFDFIEDDPPGFGPLGGIVTGLEHSKCEHNLILAIDYPLVQSRLLQLLLKRSADAQAVCGRSTSHLEPLVAYYHSDCAPVARRMIASGEIRTHKIFEEVRSYVLTDNEYNAVDPERLSRFNVNTPEDAVRAEALIRNRKDRTI